MLKAIVLINKKKKSIFQEISKRIENYKNCQNHRTWSKII